MEARGVGRVLQAGICSSINGSECKIRSYTDNTGLQPNTEYQYSVRSYNGYKTYGNTGYSAWSAWQTYRTAADAPLLPEQDTTLQVVSVNSTSALLSWEVVRETNNIPSTNR